MLKNIIELIYFLFVALATAVFVNGYITVYPNKIACRAKSRSFATTDNACSNPTFFYKYVTRESNLNSLYSLPFQSGPINRSVPSFSSSYSVETKHRHYSSVSDEERCETKDYKEVKKVPLFYKDLDNLDEWPIPETPSLVGVIFDMDGTLVKPCIDFADMRKRIYAVADSDVEIASNGNKSDDVQKQPMTKGCVLELQQKLSPQGQMKCNVIFKDIEKKAIANMQLNDGAVDLLRYLDSKSIKRAVLTRNVETSVDALNKILTEKEGIAPFHMIVARDTKPTSIIDEVDDETISHVIPSKPDPGGILHVCSIWGCETLNVIMVGDSKADDIACAYRANCGGSILLTQKGGEILDNDSGADSIKMNSSEELIPSIQVESFREIQNILNLGHDRSLEQ